MAQWTPKTEFTFDSAHYIKDYASPCGPMHGHTYRVRMEATAPRLHSSEYCPHEVMVTDFRTLRWAKRDVEKSGLDHCVLNKVMPPEYETTTEMIAKFIYDKTCQELPEGITLKVCMSETPDSWVEYEEDA